MVMIHVQQGQSATNEMAQIVRKHIHHIKLASAPRGQLSSTMARTTRSLPTLFLIFAVVVLPATAFRFYAEHNANIECPIAEAKPNLDLDKFMGLWYILEYQYPKEMGLADLSCLTFKFSEEAAGIMGNFSFRFPPTHGHFYHIPTMSEVVADGQDGLWLTKFKGVNLLTAVVDTDYENWAVFVQCMQEEGKNRFLSTRIMSRRPTLAPEHSLLAKETIKAGEMEGEHKYAIDQENC